MIANRFVANAWYVAGFSEELPKGVLKGHRIAGKPIVAWRTESGQIVAFDDRCVHKRMPLSAGKLFEDGVLECAYHGFCYDQTGSCVRIPAQPDKPIPTRARLKAFPVVEQDGVVWIWTGDDEKLKGVRPPRTPEVGSEEWDSVLIGPMKVNANCRLLIENLLDITHFYPLHDSNVGDIINSKIPVKFVEETVDGNHSIKSIRYVEGYKQPPLLQKWLGYDIVDREHTHCMMNPGVTRVEMRVAPPGQLGTSADRSYVIYHTHHPVDAKNLVWRSNVSCPAKLRSPVDSQRSMARYIADTLPEVIEQDRWALEKQQEMVDFPDDGYAEVHLKSDHAIMKLRKILSDMESQDQRSVA